MRFKKYIGKSLYRIKKFKKYLLICSIFSLIISIYSFRNIKVKVKAILNKNVNLLEKEDNSILLEKIKKGEDFLVRVNFNGAIKEIFFSEYIIGVAAAEIGFKAPIEAIKAQMVAALSYAIKKFGLNNVFSVGNSFQNYMTKEERIEKFGIEKEKEIENLKFKPVVMQYENEIVETLYATCFPGISRGNHEAWFDDDEKFQKEYLPSVFSPELKFYNEFNSLKNKEDFFKKYGQQAHHVIKLLDNCLKKEFKENVNIVFEKIKKQNKNAKMPANVKDSVKIISRFPTGYVNDVEIFGVKLKGGDVRRILNMNSSCFTVKVENNEIIFSCVGNGHGVGMSQIGAMIYALKGLNFKQILTHYYSKNKNLNKISFKQLKDVNSKLLFK